MKERSLVIVFLLYFSFSSKAQETLDWTEYMKRIQKADTLYKNGNFVESATAYSNAFIFNEQHFSEGDRYNAARAWAKAEQLDSALANLQWEIKVGFHQLKRLKKEPAFALLKKKDDWKIILQDVETNQKAENKRLGKLKDVKPKLENILILDQKFRQHYGNTLSNFGPSSKEMKMLLEEMNKTDKDNLKYVSKVLDKHGWIDYRLIGHDASAALFLVIQHGDSSSQEKYLPLLKDAVKQKKAFGHDLALLEDRVLLRRGQKQVYGSQIQCDSNGKNCWLFPIEDEKNVDKRRIEVGLEPLAVYVKRHWNIIYKVPE